MKKSVSSERIEQGNLNDATMPRCHDATMPRCHDATVAVGNEDLDFVAYSRRALESKFSVSMPWYVGLSFDAG